MGRQIRTSTVSPNLSTLHVIMGTTVQQHCWAIGCFDRILPINSKMKYMYNIGIESLIYLAKICVIGIMIGRINMIRTMSELMRINRYKSKKNSRKIWEDIKNGGNDITNMRYCAMRYSSGTILL